jgi:GTP cyclohydrolase I
MSDLHEQFRAEMEEQFGVGGGQLQLDTCRQPKSVIADSIEDMLRAIGEDITRPGLKGTPERVARMYVDELCIGMQQDLPSLLSTRFPAKYDEIVLVKDIEFWSLCEHHMVPFYGKAHVAYIPKHEVVGLSKLARLVEAASKRLNIQEQMTSNIAEAIEDALQPQGTAVIIEAEHMCMVMRGIRKPGTTTTTSVMEGAFRLNSDARHELMTMIYGSK